MKEIGIDLTAAQPQRLTIEIVGDASLLITMGCGDECPYVPGLATLDWPLEDPAGRDIGAVRVIRDEIRSRVSELAMTRGWLATR